MMGTTKLRRFSRNEYKVKWVGYTNHHNSWVAEEDLHANCLLKQFQASRSSATTDRVWNPRNTMDSVQAEHWGSAVAFPWNSNPHIPVRDELRSMLNKHSLPSSSLACGMPSPTFKMIIILLLVVRP